MSKKMGSTTHHATAKPEVAASNVVLVLERTDDWDLEVPGTQRVSARAYLTEPLWAERRGLKVFNLCRSHRYQGLGYYVSLLAEARGHRPLPTLITIQDLKSRSQVKSLGEDLDRLMAKSLAPLASDAFTLSVYFGRNMAARHEPLARAIFNLFPAPLLRAFFVRDEDGWQLDRVRPISTQDIPAEHRDFATEAARGYFAGRVPRRRRRTVARYDLAILVDPEEANPPSNEAALKRFERAAADLGLGAERITRDDAGRLAAFDALLIRETTAVHHHTYRLARRAATDGLAVIDDPQSILRCSNKVYLAELLARRGVPTPPTVIVHRDNLDEALAILGLPVILKLPDGAFSRAVVRADDRDTFFNQARAFLETSDLVVAQAFLPTDFDWRIGILDRAPLYACRYGMARGHWQIVRRDAAGRETYGQVGGIDLGEAPPAVLQTALAAAAGIGDGLYGVDLKEKDGKLYVIEVNDNPNLDAGCEDQVLGMELYRRILGSLLIRVERRGQGATVP